MSEKISTGRLVGIIENYGFDTRRCERSWMAEEILELRERVKLAESKYSTAENVIITALDEIHEGGVDGAAKAIEILNGYIGE